MVTQKITKVTEENQTFFETRTTKDGTYYRAVAHDFEISGFTTSRTKAVVERIVRRSIEMPKEVPPNVAMAADKLVDYVAATVDQFGSDYASVSVAVRAGEAKMVLTVYLTYYSDDKISEWRGGVEASVEWDNGKRVVKHVVKKRVVLSNVSAFAIYRQLLDVARRAYAVVEE